MPKPTGRLARIATVIGIIAGLTAVVEFVDRMARPNEGGLTRLVQGLLDSFGPQGALERAEGTVLWVIAGNTVSIIDEHGKEINTFSGINVSSAVGGNRRIGVAPDGAYAVIATTGHATEAYNRLARFEVDGTLSWSIPDGRFISVDVAVNGYAYAIQKIGDTTSVLKIDCETGKVEKSTEISRAFDIVVDEKNGSVWVAGSDVRRLDLDLNQEMQVNPIDWQVASIDYGADGSLLVAERGRRGVAGSRLLRVLRSGTVQELQVLDFSPCCVAVDRGRWDIWVAAGWSGNSDNHKLLRYGLKRTPKVETYRGTLAKFLVFDRPSRSLWVGTRNGAVVRVSEKGQEFGRFEGFAQGDKSIALGHR